MCEAMSRGWTNRRQAPLENEKRVYYNTFRRLIAFNLITEIPIRGLCVCIIYRRKGYRMAKIDIISGFLGAGKTTLIKKLITDVFAGQKVVLIENEFGEIGIDGGFLKDAGINITEMNSGCICCSLVGDFAEALKKVVEQFHPDHIIIEPSGVGKLSDIRDAVERVGKDCDLEIGSLVTVADVKKVKMYMKNFGEFYNNQIESAGTIILSRTQDATKEKIDEAIAMIREKNPEATIITTPWDELSGKTIHDAMVQSVSLADLLLAEEEEHHHHHDDDEDEDEHEHHHHHHHDMMMRMRTSMSTIITTITTMMTRMRTSMSTIITIITSMSMRRMRTER